MQATWIRRILGVAAIAALVGAAVFALRPVPLPVDMATVDRGPLAVTVVEEGLARIADVYTVSAPIAGTLERTAVDVGDAVASDTTIVARIRPVDPPFLDARTRREIEAAVAAAQAAVVLAEAQLAGAESAASLRESDLERAKRLSAAGTISSRELERSVTELETAQAQVGQAAANLELRKSEQARAEASLLEPDVLEPAANATCCLAVAAPVDGVVLDVLATSEQVVAAGTPLVKIGAPDNMEVIVHLLSSDAVQVAEGARAELTGWGGEGALAAHVLRVDPAAYTKVSALGIEEQRVDAVLALDDDPSRWQGLGHDFRVMVHITLWEEADALRVPISALFRRGAAWHVFTVEDGQAALTPVEIGERNAERAEVVAGLEAGAEVIVHPSDRIAAGVRVVSREEVGG